MSPTIRWVAFVLTAAALLAGGALEVAFGQTPPIEGMDRLSPEERGVAQRNLERWQKMSPEERAQAREQVRQQRQQQRQQLRQERQQQRQQHQRERGERPER